MKKMFILIVVGIGVFVIWFFFSRFTFHLSPRQEGNMKLTSVFENNTSIPSEYTCDGYNLAPILNISQVPTGTKELVLIVDDPDAPVGNFVHWVLYNIPTDTKQIDNKKLPTEVKQGMTDFGRIGWGGPCPPSGVHRYFFKLYALDSVIDLPIGATKFQVENAAREHVIEKAELIGLYQRK